jgi:hypothetical protein
MMPNDYDLYVGIDWATEAHQVCLLDATGGQLDEQPVAYTGPAPYIAVHGRHRDCGGDCGA